MTHRLRVASYNLRDLKDDRAAVVRVIRAIDPDVLCLQEVPRHPFSGHRVADLAARCGLYWSGGHRGSGGTTVLSSLRMDMRAADHARLPVARFQRERGYAVARLALPGHHPLTVVSVHLSLDGAERTAHAQDVLGVVGVDAPMVLAGDLNEQSDGSAWSAFAGRLRAVTGEAPTFTSRHPRHRLDAIFATPSLRVIGGPAVRLERADLVAATDHLPVWVDLDLADLAEANG